jgi:hypothetical protein
MTSDTKIMTTTQPTLYLLPTGDENLNSSGRMLFILISRIRIETEIKTREDLL